MTGIFFDIDDTLYSRRALLLKAARETAADALAVCGEPGSPQEDRFMEIFYKHGDENYPLVVTEQITPWQSNVWRYVRTLEDLGVEVTDDDGEAFTRRYTYLQQHMTLSEDLQELMKDLSARPDIRIGVITNGASEFQWKKVYMLGLDSYMDKEAVVVSGDIGISKPEAGIFLEAAGRLGLAPEDLWMVGDSVRHDIEGAKACGWHTLWIRRNMEDPEGVDTDLIADDEAGMCRLLRQLGR